MRYSVIRIVAYSDNNLVIYHPLTSGGERNRTADLYVANVAL